MKSLECKKEKGAKCFGYAPKEKPSPKPPKGPPLAYMTSGGSCLPSLWNQTTIVTLVVARVNLTKRKGAQAKGRPTPQERSKKNQKK